jgi:hypothetical protein
VTTAAVIASTSNASSTDLNVRVRDRLLGLVDCAFGVVGGGRELAPGGRLDLLADLRRQRVAGFRVVDPRALGLASSRFMRRRSVIARLKSS